jgi:hypothetical protein
VTGAGAQTVTFSDGDFTSGWSDINLILDDPAISGTGPGTSTAVIFTPLTAGNPGAHRESTHNIDLGDVVKSGGVNQNAAYDPATSGAISFIDFSMDLLEDPTVFSTSGYSFVVEQNGTRYFSESFSFSNSAWQNFQNTGLTAADFDTNPVFSVPGGVRDGNQPDFAAGASTLTFGYALGNRLGLGGATSGTLVHRVDNWSVTIHAVPVPAAVYLFASGLMGLAGAASASRSRRKSRA